MSPFLFPGWDEWYRDDDGTLAERFATFDAANPEVYEAFRRIALSLKRDGHNRGAAQQIIERIRWEMSVNHNREGGFKISNGFRTLYAKKLIKDRPEFNGFFEFRGRSEP